MKKFNYLLSLILLICFLLNLFKPFVENHYDEYFYRNETQKYEDVFYDNNCYPESFYWIGYYSKADFKDDEYKYDKNQHDSFIELLKECEYKSVSYLESYFVTLVSGKHNTLVPFSGSSGAFLAYNSCFNQETLDYALTTNNKISDGIFINCFGKVYLIASIFVGNSFDSALEYEIPNIRQTGVFEIDSVSTEKVKALSSDLTYIDGVDFWSNFTVEWFIVEMILLVLYFIIRPLKDDRKRIRKDFLDKVKLGKNN